MNFIELDDTDGYVINNSFKIRPPGT